jgi:AcrR family transcriptional regulator
MAPKRPTRRPAQQIRAATIRTAILEAARTIYSTGGYNSVTMRAIAGQLGLQAPSLYRHFVSKEQIFVALQQQSLELLLVKELTPAALDSVEDLRLFYWRYYEFSKRHPDYFSLLFLDRSAPAFDTGIYESETMKILNSHAEARVRRCIGTGVFPADTDVARAKSALWAAAHGPAGLRLIHKDQSLNFDQLASDTLNGTIAGLRAGAVRTDFNLVGPSGHGEDQLSPR